MKNEGKGREEGREGQGRSYIWAGKKERIGRGTRKVWAGKKEREGWNYEGKARKKKCKSVEAGREGLERRRGRVGEGREDRGRRKGGKE
jgi:hypothetical protein